MKVLIEASEAYRNRGGIGRFSRGFLRHLPHGFGTAYRPARFCDSHYVPCPDVYHSLSFLRIQPIRDSVLLTGQSHSNEEQQIQHMAQQLEVRARFVCYIPESDLAALYRLAEFVVLTSAYGGFGLPMIVFAQPLAFQMLPRSACSSDRNTLISVSICS
jgi:hypothetical protein